MAIVLLNGCATGKNSLTPEFGYGNPEYRHVSELPQNQSAAWQAKQPLSPELPEMTDNEYEALGDAMLKQQNFALAYLQYEKSLKKNPGNPRVKYKIGMTYLGAGKLDDALEHFRALSATAPETAVVWEGMGRAYFLKRDYPAAETYFLKALELDHGLWESHDFLGYIYDGQKAYSKAIAQYLSALAINPDRGSIYNNLGVSYSLAGRFPEAIEAFKAALAHNYTHAKAYNNLGMALASNGQYGQALEVFKKGVGEALAYNNLGTIHLQAGHYDEAIRCFEKAIELDPRFNARVKRNLKMAQMEKMKSENQ